MIRKAKSNDSEEIYQLGELITSDFRKLFDIPAILEESFSLILVSEENNKVVAFLHATILYESVDIINICVKPEYRRQFHAMRLIDELITNLDNRVDLITLEVSVDNIPAIHLYEKFGFKIINTRKNYYHYDTDAYVMALEVHYE